MTIITASKARFLVNHHKHSYDNNILLLDSFTIVAHCSIVSLLIESKANKGKEELSLVNHEYFSLSDQLNIIEELEILGFTVVASEGGIVINWKSKDKQTHVD